MATKTRPNKATKATTTQPTVRLNVSIPSGAWERLVLHSTMTRRSQADLVTELIEENLRSYRIQHLGPKESDQPAESTPIASSVESSASVAA